MAPRLSSLASNLSTETAFTVLAEARALKAKGKDVVELEIGDSPFPSTTHAKLAGIEAIAKKRGCLIKGRGGELDLEKAAAILLVDYRTGTLGRISVETPALRKARLAEPLPPQIAAVDPEND